MLAEVGRSIIADCPSCGPRRSSEVLRLYVEVSGAGNNLFTKEYRTIRCEGCKVIQFQVVWSEQPDERGRDGALLRREEKVIYLPPLPKRKIPPLNRILTMRDRIAGRIYVELYKALNSDLTVLAAIGVRTLLDRATELLGIDPALPFDQKLNALRANGHIGQEEYRILGVLIDAGGAAAHRGWQPSEGDLNDMVGALEGFLQRALVSGRQIEGLAGRVPPRPPRRP